MSLLAHLGGALARFLSTESASPYPNLPTNAAAVKNVIRASDVLLIDGRNRISTAIKYLTQSTWSHAALCIEAGPNARLIEADAVEGVRCVPLSRYAGFHVRICRPVGLSADDIARICSFALAREGHRYDLRNVFDLARYLFPMPPVPAAWRRRMIGLGSGDPTKAICSSLIATAFQSVRYPILPVISLEMVDMPGCEAGVRELLHVRHHSLFTPRDFDVSPYFQIIKPTLESSFDPHALAWDDRATHLRVNSEQARTEPPDRIPALSEQP